MLLIKSPQLIKLQDQAINQVQFQEIQEFMVILHYQDQESKDME